MTSTENQVRLQTEFTDSITTEQRLKQGDRSAPLLYDLIFESILRRLRADLKGTTDVLAYAYDIAIVFRSLSDENYIYIYNELVKATKKLEINTNKTELLIQNGRADKLNGENNRDC
jgi:hypothetical protein